MSSFQCITIGSALVDVFVHSDSFKEQESGELRLEGAVVGGKLEIERLFVASGGGASNVAVGLARLGFETACLAETGQDAFSAIVVREMQKENVDTRLLIHEKKEQTGGSVILVSDQGGRTVMVHRGAASQLDPQDIPPYWLSQAGWLHLGNLGGQVETVRKIFSLGKKQTDQRISWNPGGADLQLFVNRELAPSELRVDVLFVNKTEWDVVESVQEDLLKQISQIVITDGKRGGDIYLAGKHSYHFPVTEVKAVDETGAGDAFAAGYIGGLLVGKPAQEAVVWGVRNAQSVIQYFGAKKGLLVRDQVEAA